MSKQALKRVRASLALPVNREPLPAFAWPGGYPIVYLFADGGALCPDCASANIVELDRARTEPRRNSHGGWRVDGWEPNYEDTELHCDHCHKRIPCAYVAEDGPDPSACECDNTHEQNDTVCRWCWSHGRRRPSDPEVGESHETDSTSAGAPA